MPDWQDILPEFDPRILSQVPVAAGAHYPKVAIVFSVDANNFLKVSDFWFWDAARHNNDDNIKIRNALI